MGDPEGECSKNQEMTWRDGDLGWYSSGGSLEFSANR